MINVLLNYELPDWIALLIKSFPSLIVTIFINLYFFNKFKYSPMNYKYYIKIGIITFFDCLYIIIGLDCFVINGLGSESNDCINVSADYIKNEWSDNKIICNIIKNNEFIREKYSSEHNIVFYLCAILESKNTFQNLKPLDRQIKEIRPRFFGTNKYNCCFNQGGILYVDEE